MRIWQQTCLDSLAFKEATPLSWMYAGIYFIQKLKYKMKKVKSPSCICDGETIENLAHFILHCDLYKPIREEYIPKYVQINKNVLSICEDEKLILISILDPLSFNLPENETTNWSSVHDVYKLSRKFIYRTHLKREKIYSES